MAKKASKAGATARRRTNTGGTVRPARRPAATSGNRDEKTRLEAGRDTSDNSRPEEPTLTGLERERDEALAQGFIQPHPQNAPRMARTSTQSPPVGRAHVNLNVGEQGDAGKGEILVRAKALGYYNHVRRRPEDVFRLVPRQGIVEEPIIDPKTDEPKERDGRILTKRVNRILTAEEQFSDRWMEKVGEETEEKVTTSGQALKQHHDELLAAKTARGTGSSDVI